MIKPPNTNKKGIIISFIKTQTRALLLVPINEGPVNNLEPIEYYYLVKELKKWKKTLKIG